MAMDPHSEALFNALIEAGLGKEKITGIMDSVAGKMAAGSGAMTDAAKRRLDTDGFSLVGTDDGLEDKVEPHLGSVQPQPKAYAAPGLRTHDGYGTPFVPSGTAMTMIPGPAFDSGHWEGDPTIPMPVGIETIEHWSKVVCELEGFKGLLVRGKTFGELLAESHTSAPMKSYLTFLVKRFRKDITSNPQTQGPDLAAFCLRCFFEPAPESRYQRKFK